MAGNEIQKYKRLKASSLSQLAYHKIKEDIMEGIFKQGELISIAALSSHFEISRTPITIACQQLEYEGFLEILPKQGVIVKSVSLSEAREVYEVRAAIEPYCARKAFSNFKEEDIRFLEESYLRQEQAVFEKDSRAFMKEDLVFHQYLLSKAENARFLAILNGIYDRLYLIGVINLEGASRLRESLVEHRGIIECLIQRDHDGYVEQTERHISTCYGALTNSFPL